MQPRSSCPHEAYVSQCEDSKAGISGVCVRRHLEKCQAGKGEREGRWKALPKGWCWSDRLKVAGEQVVGMGQRGAGWDHCEVWWGLRRPVWLEWHGEEQGRARRPPERSLGEEVN